MDRMVVSGIVTYLIRILSPCYTEENSSVSVIFKFDFLRDLQYNDIISSLFYGTVVVTRCQQRN